MEGGTMEKDKLDYIREIYFSIMDHGRTETSYEDLKRFLNENPELIQQSIRFEAPVQESVPTSLMSRIAQTRIGKFALGVAGVAIIGLSTAVVYLAKDNYDVKKQFDTAKTEWKAIETRYESDSAEKERLSSQVTALEATLESMSKELEKDPDFIALQEKIITNANKYLSKMGSLDDLKEINSDLININSTDINYTVLCAAVEKSIKILENKNELDELDSGVKEKIKEITAKRDSLQAQRDSLQVKIDGYDAKKKEEFKELQETIDSKIAEIESLKGDLSTETSKKIEWLEEIHVFEATFSSDFPNNRTGINDSLKDELAYLVKIKEAYDPNKVSDLKSRMSSIELKNQLLLKEYDSEMSKRKVIETANENLKNQLETLAKTSDELLRTGLAINQRDEDRGLHFIRFNFYFQDGVNVRRVMKAEDYYITKEVVDKINAESLLLTGSSGGGVALNYDKLWVRVDYEPGNTQYKLIFEEDGDITNEESISKENIVKFIKKTLSEYIE
jgi:hypothetical protein